MYQIEINNKTTLKPILNANEAVYWWLRLDELTKSKERIEIIRTPKVKLTDHPTI